MTTSEAPAALRLAEKLAAHKDPEPIELDAGTQSMIEREIHKAEQAFRHLRRFLGMETDSSQ